MSFSRISTGLDVTIIHYLDGDVAALKALCSTSQYHHSVAAPLLYKTIGIEDLIEDRLPCLLSAIIDSPRLADYIKSFTMFHDEDTPDKIVIRNVHHVMRKLQESRSHIAFSILQGGNKDINDVLESDEQLDLVYFELDAAVALILDMAVNIETVRLEVATEQFYKKSYVVAWAEYAFHMSKPVTNLKSIEIYQSVNDSKRQRPELDFFLYTSAQRIVLHQGHIDYLKWPVRSLELSDIVINPSVLENILSTKAFSQLTNLIVTQLQNNPDCSRYEYDFQRLSDVIREHLKCLQTFTCTNGGFGLYDGRLFRSFRSFSRLQTLRIDWNMLIDYNLRTKQDYAAMFPQHRHNLELVNLNHHTFETWSQFKYGKWLCGLDEPDYTDVYMEAWEFITAESWPTTDLETLTLVIYEPSNGSRDLWVISEKTLIELQAAHIGAAAHGLFFASSRRFVGRQRHVIYLIDQIPTMGKLSRMGWLPMSSADASVSGLAASIASLCCIK